MSDLSDLAEEASEANDAAWFKDNAGRITRALAGAVSTIADLEARVSGTDRDGFDHGPVGNNPRHPLDMD